MPFCANYLLAAASTFARIIIYEERAEAIRATLCFVIVPRVERWILANTVDWRKISQRYFSETRIIELILVSSFERDEFSSDCRFDLILFERIINFVFKFDYFR